MDDFYYNTFFLPTGFASAGTVGPTGFPFNYVSGFVSGPPGGSSRPNGT